jgi:signal transduction histidine kinase
VEAGSVGGTLPFSRMETYGGKGMATKFVRGLAMHRDKFPDLQLKLPDLVKKLVALMSDRVRFTARMQQQREKMMALGKLSAGLAHELNNPAAAIRSATSNLLERLSWMPNRVVRLAKHGLNPQQLDEICKLSVTLADRNENRHLKALERSELEDEISDWLEDHGVDKPWTMAETFIDAGLNVEKLERIAETVPEAGREDLFCWVEGHVAIHSLALDVHSASQRISDLVESIKSYSHMDRGREKEFVNIHDGIDSTLVMLGHKLKRRGIRVERNFHENLPHLRVLPGELNQVWTNLIDNALDAMKDNEGVLEITTKATEFGVCVSIADNGAGIPEDIQSRVFEPFFTTKEVGKGTGLGLDIVHRIIIQQHGGMVDLESKPGRTVFKVSLPGAAGELPVEEETEAGAA